jgi:hypothetical protein
MRWIDYKLIKLIQELQTIGVFKNLNAPMARNINTEFWIKLRNL